MAYKAKPIEEGRYALRFDVFEGDTQVGSTILSQPVVKIGKLSSSGLRLEDDEVSRMHAVIEVNSPDDICIVDLGSRFGTFLNGARVNRANLKIGDEIVLGSRIRIVIRDPKDKKGNMVGYESPPSPPSPPSSLPTPLQQSMNSVTRTVSALRQALQGHQERQETFDRMNFTECIEWAGENNVWVHFDKDSVHAWIGSMGEDGHFTKATKTTGTTLTDAVNLLKEAAKE